MYSIRKFKDKFIIFISDKKKIKKLKNNKNFKIFSITYIDKKPMYYEFMFKLPDNVLHTISNATDYVKVNFK